MMSKKNLLLCLIAFSVIGQTPVSSKPTETLKYKAKNAYAQGLDWFYATAPYHKPTIKCPSNTSHGWDSHTRDCIATNLSRESFDIPESKKICPTFLGSFISPYDTVRAAIFYALLARIIQGNLKLSDMGKIALSSAGGSMGASLMRTASKKFIYEVSDYFDDSTKYFSLDHFSVKALICSMKFLAKLLQHISLQAGQNPEAVKAIIASIKKGTVKEDFKAFRATLKNIPTHHKIAVLLRTFGPYLGNEPLRWPLNKVLYANSNYGDDDSRDRYLDWLESVLPFVRECPYLD